MQAPPSPPHIEELSDAEEVVDLERSRRDPTDTARGHTSDADTSAPASVESSLCSSSSEDSASDSLTAYEVLGVETNATRHVIKKAFKRKVAVAKDERAKAKTDNDWAAAQCRVRVLEEVYKVLRDETLRAEYDKRLLFSKHRAGHDDDMLLMAPKAEAELQAPTEPSELMAAGHSTLATIPEGKILTTVEDRHALTRSSNPFENSVEDKLQDTQEPDSARYRGLELAQAPVRQSTPYSLTNLGIRETTAGPLNHKHQESQIGLQTHDHQHQQAIVHIPVASRAVAKYGVANSRSPMVASGHLRGPQAPVPATYLHQQRNPPHNQLVVSRATVPIPGNADGQWTGTPIPAALRGEMTVLDRERERDHILESSRYSGAIDAARRVLAPFHYQQLMPFQQSLMQLPHQPATQSQVMTVPLPQQQALTIPQTWSTPATHMDQILAGSGQLLGGLFGPGTGGLLAGSGSFSTSHTSIRITFDPRAGTAFGSQQSNVFQRDANGQIRMESDRRDFTRH